MFADKLPRNLSERKRSTSDGETLKGANYRTGRRLRFFPCEDLGVKKRLLLALIKRYLPTLHLEEFSAPRVGQNARLPHFKDSGKTFSLNYRNDWRSAWKNKNTSLFIKPARMNYRAED